MMRERAEELALKRNLTPAQVSARTGLRIEACRHNCTGGAATSSGGSAYRTDGHGEGARAAPSPQSVWGTL